MKTPRAQVVRLLLGWLSGLRFPVLFLVAAALFAVDLFAPDAFPFVDELLLGLATVLLGRLKSRRSRDGAARPAPPVEVVVDPPSRRRGRA